VVALDESAVEPEPEPELVIEVVGAVEAEVDASPPPPVVVVVARSGAPEQAGRARIASSESVRVRITTEAASDRAPPPASRTDIIAPDRRAQIWPRVGA
jgi:hypothetical protein